MHLKNLKTFKESTLGIVYLLPGLGILIVFGIMPICLAVYMSFYRWKPVKGKFLGFSHYDKFLGDIS